MYSKEENSSYIKKSKRQDFLPSLFLNIYSYQEITLTSSRLQNYRKFLQVQNRQIEEMVKSILECRLKLKYVESVSVSQSVGSSVSKLEELLKDRLDNRLQYITIKFLLDSRSLSHATIFSSKRNFSLYYFSYYFTTLTSLEKIDIFQRTLFLRF